MRRVALRRLDGLASLVALAVLASCTNLAPPRTASLEPDSVVTGLEESGLLDGARSAVTYRLPNVTLTADNGAPFNLASDTAYRITLVYVGYTNCPTVCQFVVSDVAAALRLLPSAVRQSVQFLFITADPSRDRPAVLRRWLHGFDPTFVGLTGSLPAIEATGESLGIAIAGRRILASGGYVVGHSTPLLGFVGQTIKVSWPPDTAVPSLSHDLLILSDR